MDARVTKVARISARFSEFLARRRFCQNQEKVRSLDHPAARQDDEAPFPARRNRESRYGRNATHFWVTLLASKPAASCLNDATRGQIGQILPYRPLRARARTPAIRPISGHPSNPSIRVSECRLCTLSLLHRRGLGSNAVV
jgi:hypothetical protein